MRPLDGIKVVTLEHAIAAPFCTRQLADLGARVIKVERPGVGDFARGYDERVHGLSSHFVWTNRSKESLALDLKQPEAAKILDALVADADVLVQNLAPGAADRLGLGYETLSEKYPKLIVCDISGYGSDGAYPKVSSYEEGVTVPDALSDFSRQGPSTTCQSGFDPYEVTAWLVASGSEGSDPA